MKHPNQVHKDSLTRNDKIAVWISDHVGSMICAYVFCGIGVGSLIGVITGNTILALVCGAVSSYFIQLVLLPIIMVAQNLESRHSEAVADHTYQATEEILRLLKKK